MRSLVELSLRNLAQSRTRTTVIVMSVALGVATLIAAPVFSSGVSQGWTDKESSLTFISDMGDILFYAMGSLIMLAAAFLIFNAFAMTVTQRQQQLATLRLLGMTRRQVLRTTLGEALATGGIGTLLGMLVGPLLGRATLALVGAMGLNVGRGEVSLQTTAAAFGMGIGITLLAALIPARRAARVAPMIALREVSSMDLTPPRGRRWVTLAGLGLMAAILTGQMIAPPGKWTGKHPPADIGMVLASMTVWVVAVILVAPALTGLVLRMARWVLYRWSGHLGRMVADNLQRAPSRVTLTGLSFAISFLILIGGGGQVHFMDDILVRTAAEDALNQAVIIVIPYDGSSGVGMASAFDQSAPGIDPLVAERVADIAEGRAEVGERYFIGVPELSAPIPGFFSSIIGEMDLQSFRRPGVFHLIEGDLDTALRFMEESPCAFMTTTTTASRNNLEAGDAITINTPKGPAECVLAGLGTIGIPSVTLLNPNAKALFIREGRQADNLVVRPNPEADRADVEAELAKLPAEFPGKAYLVTPQDELDGVLNTEDQLMNIFYGMVLLGLLAAVFGMTNTVLVSVIERQREIGLLRAVGATRKQLAAILMGESALTALYGALLGIVFGTGIAALTALSLGGSMFGLDNINLQVAALKVVGMSLLDGIPMIIAAPLFSVLITYPIARQALRGSAIDTLQPERRDQPLAKAVGGLLSRGTLQVRFAVGTGLLLLILLAGLVFAVTAHLQGRMQSRFRDGYQQMMQMLVGMIEPGLPSGLQDLNMATLSQIPVFRDITAQMRVDLIMEKMSQSGLTALQVTNRENTILLSSVEGEIGRTLDPLKSGDISVYSVKDGSRWTDNGEAPLYNPEGRLVGSVRMNIVPLGLFDMAGRLRSSMLAVGAGIILLSVLISAWLARPLSQTARQLAEHAAEARSGQFTLLETPAAGKPKKHIARWSIRTRLTLVLVLFILMLVSGLQAVTAPMEKRYLDSTYQDSISAVMEIMGISLAQAITPQAISSPAGMQMALEQTVGNLNTVFVALLDAQGKVLAADPGEMVGQTLDIPSSTSTIQETWKGQPIWQASTPIRPAWSDQPVGFLVTAASRESEITFLEESRLLFLLAGIIALLAGIFLAQAVGEAVAAPVQALAAGTRRVAQGDFSTHFDVRTQDELSTLATAYNQMVVGLQEREWLRDMFGRFVSPEVVEAMRSGRVQLEGENRVVTALFCDIRGYTARSETLTPREIVQLLNEFRSVLVEAVQRHHGSVNQFSGDGAFVIFGAPKALEDSARCAILAALDFRQGLVALNERLAARGDPPIRIGVGINTGAVVAGAVGPRERQEYTVIGDPVNLASRIEALNKQYPEHDILISEYTCQALGEGRREFELVPLGPVAIRGKAEAVEIFAVRGLF